MGNRSRKVAAPKQLARNGLCPCGSGKKFKRCHGEDAPPVLVEAPSTTLVKLDLACGQNVKEGFQGVDIVGNEKLGVKAVDLWKFPWPWEDNSVDEIYCSHHIEHIPAREIEERDISIADNIKGAKLPPGMAVSALSATLANRSAAIERFLGQDMFFAFFDECWRILKPECWMQVICPAARSSRAFWDPTHRRFIEQVTFLYLNAEWRKSQGLDHYKVRCNFGADVGYSAPQEELARHAEVHTDRFQHQWNVIHDWMAKLKCIK